MLTPSQAGLLAQVKPETIYRWLGEGRVHGAKTPDAHQRICSRSLFATEAVRDEPGGL